MTTVGDEDEREGVAVFIPTPRRSHADGWFASVTREGYQNGYWRSPRFTRWGAALASRRMAWWLNRQERSLPWRRWQGQR